MKTVIQEADELLPRPEDDDFELKELVAEPAESPKDHIECGQKCQLCGTNYCVLLHRRDAKAWLQNHHWCQECLNRQIEDML